jgi:hypothetical protein
MASAVRVTEFVAEKSVGVQRKSEPETKTIGQVDVGAGRTEVSDGADPRYPATD